MRDVSVKDIPMLKNFNIVSFYCLKKINDTEKVNGEFACRVWGKMNTD